MEHIPGFQSSEINMPSILFSRNIELKSSRPARWKLNHDVFIKPSTGFDTQRNTRLIQDTFLALKGLTALIWLMDHPTTMRMEKPHLHFGLIVLRDVTGQEIKRALEHMECGHGLAAPQPVCTNSTSSLAAE